MNRPRPVSVSLITAALGSAADIAKGSRRQPLANTRSAVPFPDITALTCTP